MTGTTEQPQDSGTDLHRVESLDDLAAQASAMDAPALAPQAAGTALAIDTTEQDLLAALRVAQAIARGGVWWMKPEEFEAQWGDQTLRAIAAPGAEIMRRQGWTMGEALSKWGPYIALGGALLPPAMATVAAYKQARAKQHQQGAASGQQKPA